MPKRTRSYQDWLNAKLSDPERAARYLNTAAGDSEAMFLKALRKVASAQGRSMTEIADASGISRESLYRMLSETGNPTSENRRAILAVLGLRSIVVPMQKPKPSTSIEFKKPDDSAASTGVLEGNPLSGGRRLGSFLTAGATTPRLQTLTTPAWTSGNFTSVGCDSAEFGPSGGRH